MRPYYILCISMLYKTVGGWFVVSIIYNVYKTRGVNYMGINSSERDEKYEVNRWIEGSGVRERESR